MIYFYSNPISGKINDWSAFGSYIGGTVAALTIPFSFYLLIRTYQIQKETEITANNTLDNQKFEKRLFELISVFNEYRYNHMKGWVQTGNQPKEHYNGFDFFKNKRTNIQWYLNTSDISFDVAYLKEIKSADLNFEFYFRCIENMLNTIEDLKNENDKSKLLKLISNLLTNDEKFFIKYFDINDMFVHFNTLKKYKNELVKDLYFDYKK